MKKELFALFRLGLGNSTAEKENLSYFNMLSAAQWTRLGEIAQEQGVLGVILDGIGRLEAIGCSVTRELSKEQKLEWIVNVLNGYETRNQHQLDVIADLQKKWAESGLRVMVMKGQAMGTYYPVPNHRCPGDIDCYLFGGYAKGNETAKVWADKVDEHWYKHSVISYNGETIENHQYFVHTREGRRSKQLNELLVQFLNGERLSENCHRVSVIEGTEVLLPPTMFNAVFLTYHALAHFLEEGLRFKQILDWAVFLKRDADKVDWEEFWKICDKFYFRRFAEVMNDIAVNQLGVKLNNEQIVPISPYTQRVIDSTLYDNEYIFSSGRSRWSNRFHIVANLFKYRWKYNLIYQKGVLRQLWLFLTGFLFKTE